MKIGARSWSSLRDVRRRRTSAVIAAAAGSVVALIGTQDASANITHRYSFNESLNTDTQTSTVIVDSVGGSGGNGVLVNRNAPTTSGGPAGPGLAPSFSGGQLSLNNTGAGADVTKGNYVDLPNNIVGTSDVTIEVWSTWTGSGNWQRLFDIGTTNSTTSSLDFGGIAPSDTVTGYAGTSYIFISPQAGRNGNVYGSEVRNDADTNTVADNIGGGNINSTGTGEHVQTLVMGSGLLRLFRDGVLVASNPTPITGMSVSQQNSWIGRSNFAADPFYNGTLNEFRTYDNAQSPAVTLFSATLGANQLVADAVTNNFTGAGDYANAANWSAGVPGANQLAVIANGATATVGASTAFAHQLRVTNGQLAVNNGATYTVAGGVDLAGPGPASVNVSGGGVLATPSLFVDGDLTAQSGSKTITLDNGTLNLSAAPGGAVLGVGGTGVSVVFGAGNATINTGGANFTVNAPVSGAGGLTKLGGGRLELLNGSSSYGGATNVAGTLAFVQGALPGGSAATPITSNAATLVWSGANTTDITANRTVTINAGRNTFDVGANNVAFAGQIAGGGGFVKTGSGTLTINNRIANGAASADGIENFHVRAGTVTLGNGAVVQVGGTARTGRWISIGEQNGDNGTLNVTGDAQISVVGDLNVSDVPTTTGRMNLSGTSVALGGTTFVGKSGASVGAVTIAESARLGTATLVVGSGGTSVGAVRQTGGTLDKNGGGGDWRFGGNGTADVNAVGTYDLVGGSFTTSNNFQVGAYGKGQFNQTGGTTTVSGGYTAAGRFAGSFGQINVSGGNYNHTSAGTLLGATELGTGSINVYGTGTLTTAANGGLSLSIGAAGVGSVNLGTGGTIVAKSVAQNNAAGSTANGTFNFHGGTLRANAGSTAAFMQGLTNAYVWSEGGTIDTNGQNITIAQNLTAPTGSGVTQVAVTGGGAGYTTAPMVLITRGTGDTTGSGAAAVANLNAAGQVTGFTVTNPGTGYTVAPTVALLGGVPGTAATGASAALAPNAASGGITKVGAGTLLLTGTANTYTGPTNVAAGTLGGTGSLLSPVTVASAGTVAPGASVGKLSVGGFTIGGAGGTLAIELDPANAGGLGTTDNLNVTGSVALAGGNLALSVTGSPTDGQTFQIITNDLTDAVGGTFATANGSPITGNMFTLGTFNYAINYAAGDGNDVLLTATAVPEPAALGLLGLAMAGLTVRRRRAAAPR